MRNKSTILIKKKQNINNKLILSEIRSGKRGRDRIITSLYNDVELRDKIKSMLYNKGAKDDDFSLVFNNSLIQFMKTVIKNKDFEIT